ncbi:FecR domain-containing protein [Larkinella knui]|nr:FecR domain-containing protein [Larkinella knui]
MSPKDISPDLLKKYLAGTCNPEEVEQVEQWYAALNAEKADRREFNQPRHLKKIQEIVNLKTESETPPERADNVRPLAPGFWRYAAAAVVILVGSLGLYFYLNTAQPASEPTARAVSIVNTEKQVVRHQLPDGSKVWLNPDAKIQYAAGAFSETSRTVSVEGEAFFEVTKDPARPFFVKSNELLVKVLGTSFNVKSNPDQSRYEVSVVTGKVSVSVPDRKGQAKSVLLLPRQQAVFEVASGLLTSTELSKFREKVDTWQPISLTFEDEKLSEIAMRLQKKYGIKIRLANPNLANCRLKATFDHNRLAEILEITTQMVEATYEMRGDSIVIDGEGCGNAE